MKGELYGKINTDESNQKEMSGLLCWANSRGERM